MQSAVDALHHDDDSEQMRLIAHSGGDVASSPAGTARGATPAGIVIGVPAQSTAYAAATVGDAYGQSPGEVASHSLTPCSWICIALVAVFAVVLSASSWDNVIVLPLLAAAPLAVMYVVWWRRYRSQVRLDLVIKLFCFGFGPGALIVMAVETVLGVVFFLVFFKE